LEKVLFLFFSHKLNGQPTFKFDTNMDVLCIYCMILRSMHWGVEWVHGRYSKP
jgi:hypothetical protein